MEAIRAALLGLLQGVTEFLPVSSSGHLAVFGKSMQFFGLDLIVILHFGTLLAILAYYRTDVLSITLGAFRLAAAAGRAVRRKESLSAYLASDAAAHLALLIIVGSIPTAVIGLGLKGVVEFITQGHVRIVGAFFIMTGVFMFRADSFPLGGKGLGQGTLRDAVTVGIFQGLAVMPGLSRSGLTIFASVLRGFDRRDAAKFSFLLSIPALLGAGALELAEGPVSVSFWPAAIGVTIAFLSGYACLAILVRALASQKLRYFTGYLFVLGALVLLFSS